MDNYTQHDHSFSDFLFAQPSWLSGIGRLFDFWGLYGRYNNSRTERVADAKALYSDWRTVGCDIWRSVDLYAGEHGHS
jgi:hypothetical protein